MREREPIDAASGEIGRTAAPFPRDRASISRGKNAGIRDRDRDARDSFLRVESFGEVCERIVRTVLAELGPTAEQERTPLAGRVHLPLSPVIPEPVRCTEDAADGTRPCTRLSGALCLEMCGDFLQSQVPDRPLDLPTFEALRAEKGNPLELCDLSLSDEPGRRAPGPRPGGKPAQAGAEVGAYLAGMTQVEAANVGSFEELADELASHGAPLELIDRVRIAQAEERVHVVLLARMAQKHGATASAAGRKRRSRPRSLAAFACRNAADGCGSEAYNALALAWAAHTARDLAMRSLARHLAADTARHADLAHDIYTWAADKLPPNKIARLREIRATAIRNASHEAPPSLVQIKLGAPSAAVAERLADLLIDAFAAS